jgi:hypothetical protein
VFLAALAGKAEGSQAEKRPGVRNFEIRLYRDADRPPSTAKIAP